MNVLYPDFYHSLDYVLTRQAQDIIHIIFISSHNLGCVNSMVGVVFCVVVRILSDLQSENALVK